VVKRLIHWMRRMLRPEMPAPGTLWVVRNGGCLVWEVYANERCNCGKHIWYRLHSRHEPGKPVIHQPGEVTSSPRWFHSVFRPL